jgi:putative sigma-54 modulation protein
MVMDKLDRQVKKHKEKLQEKKGQAKAQFNEAAAPAPTKKKSKPKIILEKDFIVKPMSVDEAVLQLDVSPGGFFIFQNADSKQINILFKRQDGDIGLVAPLI